MKGNIYLKIEKHGKALHWRLQRRERRNALGPSLGILLHEALGQCTQELEAWQAQPDSSLEPPYRCLVLSAETIETKDPIWIAGGDLKELAQLKDPAEGRAYAALFAGIGRGLQELPIPVLAAIDGWAIGGGVELALAADIRLASMRSELHFKQLEVGLATGYGSCQRLIALLGQARATDLLLLRRRLTAKEAKDLGLINEVVATSQELEILVNQTVEGWSQLSPWALRAQKRMLQLPFLEQRNRHQELELELFQDLWMHRWHREFLEGFTLKP